jgi:hypothetical protein
MDMSESLSALSNTQDIKPHQKIEIVVRNERKGTRFQSLLAATDVFAALKFSLKKTARLEKVFDAFAVSSYLSPPNVH